MFGKTVNFIAGIICLGLACTTLDATTASAQQAACTSEAGPKATQTLRCRDGLIVVAEDGARFTLQSDPNGGVNGVDLQSKALLLDAPKQSPQGRFRVITPQAIAGVRGTKWAVDVQPNRTSVLVLQGEVAVQRPSGGVEVVLHPGDGVDVDPGSEPLVVRRWGQPRINALLSRLGQ